MSQTLQSFDSSQSSSKAKGDGDTALDMTEDDLNMFSDMNPLVSSPSEDDNILVRYSAPAATNPISLEDQPDPGQWYGNGLHEGRWGVGSPRPSLK